MNKKQCPNCGLKLDLDVNVCPNCGYHFNNEHNYNKRIEYHSHHSSMFVYITLILVIILIGLTALLVYSRNNSRYTNTSNKIERSYSTNGTTTNKTINWDSDKAASFDSEFNDWADKMDQSYESGSTTFDGVDYPSDFASKKFIINGSNATISTAESNKNTDYKVVEIRCDDNDGYLYLFAFRDGSPIVLFTQDGDVNGNSVSFKTTSNSDLTKLFNKFTAN